MKFLNKTKLVALLLSIVIQFTFVPLQKAHAASSPTLGTDLSSFSVLGGDEVTCTGSTTLSGTVGVSPGTSISGFPSPCTAGGGTQSNNATAIAAQADNLAAFGTLDQTCDQTFGAVDLTATFPSGVEPGVYCSTSSFSLTGNLNLTGSGVWIFKTVSTLITSPGSSITGGDACNVWWRVGSSATLDTTTSFKGNILSLLDITMNTGATLDGRALAQSAGTVTLDANTITGPTCAGSGGGSSSSASSSNSSSTGTSVCPLINAVIPNIIESRRIDTDSIFISWGPYSGVDTFIVRYGLENGNWLYSTNVTGFSTTLNGLPPNQPIWVQVAATNSCSIGTYAEAILVGGTASIGSPLLPNTGTGPQENAIPWYIPIASFLVLTAIFLKLKRV